MLGLNSLSCDLRKKAAACAGNQRSVDKDKPVSSGAGGRQGTDGYPLLGVGAQKKVPLAGEARGTVGSGV